MPATLAIPAHAAIKIGSNDVPQDEKFYMDIAETLDALTERVSRYRVSDLTVIYCNKAWAAGHDLTPAQAVGRSLDDILTPAEQVGLRSQLAILGPENPNKEWSYGPSHRQGVIVDCNNPGVATYLDETS